MEKVNTDHSKVNMEYYNNLVKFYPNTLSALYHEEEGGCARAKAFASIVVEGYKLPRNGISSSSRG